MRTNGLLEKRSTIVSSRKAISQNVQDQVYQSNTNKDKKITVVSSEGLIRFADYQIEKEVKANALESGKMRNLSSYEKGRLIVKFL